MQAYIAGRDAICHDSFKLLPQVMHRVKSFANFRYILDVTIQLIH